MVRQSIIIGNQNTTKLMNELKNSKEQYKILDKDEERELIEKYRNDRDKLNQLLFMHNIRIVFNMAKSYMSKTDDYDGIVQNGFIGLGVAAQKFDIDKDIKFSTYASIWVKKYMSMSFYTSQFKVERASISIDQPAPSADNQDSVCADDTLQNSIHDYIEASVEDQQLVTSETVISADEQHDLCQMLYQRMDDDTSLSAMDRAVFTDLFVNHEKTRDIAFKYNISQTDIAEIKNRMLGKCKNILVNEYKINSYRDIA